MSMNHFVLDEDTGSSHHKGNKQMHVDVVSGTVQSPVKIYIYIIVKSSTFVKKKKIHNITLE